MKNISKCHILTLVFIYHSNILIAQENNNMVFVKSGKYKTIRYKSAEPIDTVISVSDFFIDKTEVTVAAYSKFVSETGYITEAERQGWSQHYGKKMIDSNWKKTERGIDIVELAQSNRPVVNLSWNDANTYAKWIGKRLPTHNEWEYAAKGGVKSKGFKYSGSNNLMKIAWYFKNSNFRIHPVAKLEPNELGLFDMTGNAYEFCEKITLSNKEFAIIIGGDYFSDEKVSTFKSFFIDDLSKTFSTRGFRCAMDVKYQN